MKISIFSLSGCKIIIVINKIISNETSNLGHVIVDCDEIQRSFSGEKLRGTAVAMGFQAGKLKLFSIYVKRPISMVINDAETWKPLLQARAAPETRGYSSVDASRARRLIPYAGHIPYH